MKILIVVDMQNDFIHGNLGSAEARAIIPAIQEKIAEYKENEKNLIFFTQDTHYSNYLTTQEGRFFASRTLYQGYLWLADYPYLGY